MNKFSRIKQSKVSYQLHFNECSISIKFNNLYACENFELDGRKFFFKDFVLFNQL